MVKILIFPSSFRAMTAKKSGLVTAQYFFNWANDIAKKFTIVNFFGGLEPAEDVDTQLYTKTGVGENIEI
jgi:hypothetical protein